MASLAELLRQLNVPFVEIGEHHHCTTGWIQINCPYCSANSDSFLLGINESYLNCSCWSCGPHGLIDALSHITGKHFSELKDLVKVVDKIVALPSRRKLGKLVVPHGLGPLLPLQWNYLHGRGFNVKSLVRLWGIKGFANHEKYPWRIYIPITLNGKEVSFTTRSVNDEARYRSCDEKNEAYPHKDLLYGEEYCRGGVIVVEGPTDVWRVGPGAAGTFGTSYTRAQVLRIAQFPIRAIVYDSKEESAQNQAWKLACELESLPGRTLTVELKADDPGSAKKKEIKQLREAVFGKTLYSFGVKT